MNYKILAFSYLFPNKYFPFYGIFVLNRLNAVHKYCDVKVIAPVPWFPFMEKFRKFNNYTRIPKHEITEELEVYHPKFFIIPGFLKWLDSISYLFTTFPSVLRIRKEFPFDIIDVHWVYPDILAGYFYSLIFRKKLVVTIRGKEAVCFGERSLRKKIIDFLLKRAHIVVTLSSELQGIVKDIGVEEKKIIVIQNGVDVGRFLLKEREECRKRLGLRIDSKMVLSVGSLIKRKGFDRIIEVLPEVIRKHKSVKLYIVGSASPEGDYENELKKLIKKFSLEDHVVMVGAQSNRKLVTWYNAADVFCLATNNEGCPNVLMEALACGTPAVATNVGAIADIIESDLMGYIVDVNSKEELKKAIKRALSLEWDRFSIWKNMQNKTWDNCARQVLKVYDKVFKDK